MFVCVSVVCVRGCGRMCVFGSPLDTWGLNMSIEIERSIKQA